VLTPPQRYIDALAELAVGFGANVQPGQVLGMTVEPGQEPIARAVAEAAYAHGAKYVDQFLFDPHLKRSRLLHAPRETLSWVPPWVGERVLELGEMRAARISFQGPMEPHLLEDIDPELLGLDILPRVRESGIVTGQRLNNWTIVPFVTPGWASMVYPELPVEEAYVELWDVIAHICRLDEPDPVAAWEERHAVLERMSGALRELALDAVRLVGPGTDLTVGLLPSSTWLSGHLETVDGIKHRPNIPTEEVFTSPDPLRVDGFVTATKPLLIPGAAPITGLQVRFSEGRAVSVEADSGGSILRSMTERDEGAARLGELALVDRHSRVGQSGRVFSDILLDENAASHIALGRGFPFCVSDPADVERINVSDIHVDFMIGSESVDVTGVRRDGSEVPLLRGGDWQI
jgi:aminopeptidase